MSAGRKRPAELNIDALQQAVEVRDGRGGLRVVEHRVEAARAAHLREEGGIGGEDV